MREIASMMSCRRTVLSLGGTDGLTQDACTQPGLERLACDQVDWTAQEKFKLIGVKYDAGIKSTPLPWMNKHLNTNKTQTALQENESVSYLIGAMTTEVNYDQLPDL